MSAQSYAARMPHGEHLRMDALQQPAEGIGRRVAHVWREEGLPGLVDRIVARTVRPFFWIERVGFYDSDLSEQRGPDPRPPRLPIDVRPAMAHELLGRFRKTLEKDFGVTRDDAAKRVAKSHVAMIAVHDDEMVAMLWLAFNEQRVSEVGRTLQLGTGEFLTYNEATLPAWRGRGISPYLNRCAEAYARRRAAARRITWRRLGNSAAVRVATKLHDRLFAVVTTVRLFGKDRAMVFGLKAAGLPPLVPPDSAGPAARC
jgi:GNAT superfamily N-acetyltransferase